MVDEKTKTLLRLYADRYETPGFLNGDPSFYMHQVSGDENREAMAFVASSLSYGSRSQFLPKIGAILEASGGEPHGWVRSGGFSSFVGKDDGRCFYRLYTCRTMYAFLDAYRALLTEYGTMGDYLRGRGVSTGIDAVKALCGWFAAAGDGKVVPKDASSACKRLCMFLRWMVRDPSPVDLGLWAGFIDRKTLIIPLDTHVLTEAAALGLVSSRTASMSAAARLTSALAEVFPDDPLKGDFALFGYGVNH